MEEEAFGGAEGVKVGAVTSGATALVATTAGAATRLCLLEELCFDRAVCNCSMFLRTDNTL